MQKAKTIAGKEYTLLNIPFYLVHRIERELDKLTDQHNSFKEVKDSKDDEKSLRGESQNNMNQMNNINYINYLNHFPSLRLCAFAVIILQNTEGVSLNLESVTTSLTECFAGEFQGIWYWPEDASGSEVLKISYLCFYDRKHNNPTSRNVAWKHTYEFKLIFINLAGG